MGENEPMQLHQEINNNMTVSAQAPFAMTNEEMAFNRQQVWANNRSQRKKVGIDKLNQQRKTQDWVNSSGASDASATTSANIMDIGNKNLGTINQTLIVPSQQNNRASSESIETIKENIRNSQESLKKRSSDNILTIEAASKERPPSLGTIGHQSSVSNLSLHSQQSSCEVPRHCRESMDSLNESTSDLRQRSRSGSIMDPHTAAIDLSNNCRKFYFNHLKSAETIKQSVRTAKHTRARETLEGKPVTSFDHAMDRLRSEMADLMDQDLSLMSQLLKLNDKIEEIKTQVSYGDRPSAWSMSEISDSEFSDNEDSSRIELYNASTGSYRMKTLKSLHRVDKPSESKTSVNINLHRIENEETNTSTEPTGHEEADLRRIERSDSDIILYKKKPSKMRRKSNSGQDQRTPSDVDSEEDEDDTSDADSTETDTESTLSYNSQSSSNSAAETIGTDTVDSGIQQDKPPELPPKKRKGGVSQNSNFFKFHKSNGARSFTNLAGPVMTLQGHNITPAKYYVPQGLVYLKHANAENVFCQFSN